MFRFRLARVLDYRRIQQKDAERHVHQTQHQLRHEEAELAALHAESHRLDAHLSSSQGTVLTSAEVQQWRRYYQQLTLRITAQQAAVDEAANALASCR